MNINVKNAERDTKISTDTMIRKFPLARNARKKMIKFYLRPGIK